MRIETAQRVRNGLLYAFVLGVAAFLLTWVMLLVLAAPGVDLIDAWFQTADVPLTFVLLAVIAGFVRGYQRNKLALAYSSRN